jgi:hypothetical protein
MSGKSKHSALPRKKSSKRNIFGSLGAKSVRIIGLQNRKRVVSGQGKHKNDAGILTQANRQPFYDVQTIQKWRLFVI